MRGGGPVLSERRVARRWPAIRDVAQRHAITRRRRTKSFRRVPVGAPDLLPQILGRVGGGRIRGPWMAGRLRPSHETLEVGGRAGRRAPDAAALARARRPGVEGVRSLLPRSLSALQGTLPVEHSGQGIERAWWYGEQVRWGSLSPSRFNGRVAVCGPSSTSTTVRSDRASTGLRSFRPHASTNTGNAYSVAAVGQVGARDEIRSALQEAGWREVSEFIAVA